MANPQPTDAHLRVAHSINEAIMMRDFTKRQRKILDLILRLSWGCGKNEAYIPRQNDFCIVGLYEPDIKAELVWLQQSNIITRKEKFYWFNKDFDQWQISRVKPFEPKRLSELLSLNLNGNRPKLSETLTRDLVKHEVKTSQNTKSTTPKLATSKETLNKVLKKDIYIVLFNLWNDLNIITHKKLTSDMKRAIDSTGKDYTQEEIGQAMQNYAVIVKSPEYYFDHRWTLADFLSRRHSNNIERFQDLEIAKSNFRKEADRGAHRGHSKQTSTQDLKDSIGRPLD